MSVSVVILIPTGQIPSSKLHFGQFSKAGSLLGYIWDLKKGTTHLASSLPFQFSLLPLPALQSWQSRVAVQGLGVIGQLRGLGL